MPKIAIPTYIDLYDELLRRGYEGRCTNQIHDECCPYGVRFKAMIERDLTGQVSIEAEQHLNDILEGMLEADKIVAFQTFFDKAFWNIPFKHAAQLITEDGIQSFVAYLLNCLALGSAEEVLQEMRKEVELASDADLRTRNESSKPKRKRSNKLKV